VWSGPPVGTERAEQVLEVGGLIGTTEENVSWTKRKPLRVGDQIQIKLIDASAVDKPIERHRTDPKQRLKAKKNYVRMMAKELGWKIEAGTKRPSSWLAKSPRCTQNPSASPASLIPKKVELNETRHLS
jgi:hypothetical protein